ncbi:hypothetical protein M9H77_23858 [Catharanthus roseus]|uniref:Uncharacterized protein n=1 Tax=Catharanthus roseus TaxID=4058 RepID=A0ACC0AW81_CATRO|nr:hypothetical protein M9H77_23858 [Catharanthus roseus]
MMINNEAQEDFVFGMKSNVFMIKLRTLGSSQSKDQTLDELQRVNEHPQAQEVVQGSAKIHVEEETSKEDSCDLMRDKNIKKRLRLKKKIEISLGHPYTLKSMLGRSHTMELEDQEVSVPVLNSGAKFDLSCHGFGMLDDVSIVDPNVFGFELVNCAYHHSFKEVMFQTTDLHDLFIKFIKETSFCYHLPFKDISLNPFLEEFSKKLLLSNFISKNLLKDFKGTLLIFQFHWLFKDIVENAVNMCHLQYFCTFTSTFLGRSLVIFTCCFHSPSLSHPIFNFFDYNSFPYNRPFKEF